MGKEVEEQQTQSQAMERHRHKQTTRRHRQSDVDSCSASLPPRVAVSPTHYSPDREQNAAANLPVLRLEPPGEKSSLCHRAVAAERCQANSPQQKQSSSTNGVPP